MVSGFTPFHIDYSNIEILNIKVRVSNMSHTCIEKMTCLSWKKNVFWSLFIRLQGVSLTTMNQVEGDRLLFVNELFLFRLKSHES